VYTIPKLKAGDARRRREMIQIQSREQFRRAEERAHRERMLVSRTAPRTFSVLNRKNSRRYTVSFLTLNGKFFGECNCEAGTPMRGNHQPMTCKHLYAAYLVLRALTGKVRSH
jgi:hypothetical protein